MGVYDIQGLNCVFQLKIGDDYKTVVCAKSFTFNPVTDMKETTTVGSGFWKEFRPRKLSYTITFNGMLQVASLTTQEIAKTLFTYQIQFLPLAYQIIYTDNSNNVMVVRGQVYVTSSLFDASPVNLVNATQELQGNGPIEPLDQLPQPVNIHITSDGDPSIAAFIQFKLINSNGEVIFDSGQLPEASGGNLAHPVDVIGQVQAGSYYFFWQTTADSIGNIFDLDAPPTKQTAFSDGTQNENSFGVQEYDFTADRNVVFTFTTGTPPPMCVPPSIPGSPVLPDGEVGIPWATSFALAGSDPFNITNVTKPSWLSIFLYQPNGVGTTVYVMLQGTPDVAGSDIEVSFDINNACGTIPFSDTIDIAAAPPTTSTINWTHNNDTLLGQVRVYVNGTLVIDSTINGNGSDSGTFTANPGDTIEAQVNSGSFGTPTRELTVTNVTDSNILYNNSGTSNDSFVFTVLASKIYSIIGSAINP